MQPLSFFAIAVLQAISPQLTLTEAARTCQKDAVRSIYQSPKLSDGTGVWLGNLAIRSTGQILTTDFTQPLLLSINPNDPSPSPMVIANFSDATGLTGITETSHDIFEVVVGTFSSQTNATNMRLMRVDYAALSDKCEEPTISMTADLSKAPFLNGLVTLNARTVLGADSLTGSVWAIDTKTGKAWRVITNDPLMARAERKDRSPLGVNGLKIARIGRKTFLYFTNTSKTILGRIQINPLTGAPVSKLERGVVVAHTIHSDKGVGYDDFTLGHDPDTGGLVAYLADSRGNTIERLELGGNGRQEIIAGSLRSTVLDEPSAVALGRTEMDSHVLYVSTIGGLGRKNLANAKGGEILAVDLTKFDQC